MPRRDDPAAIGVVRRSLREITAIVSSNDDDSSRERERERNERDDSS